MIAAFMEELKVVSEHLNLRSLLSGSEDLVRSFIQKPPSDLTKFQINPFLLKNYDIFVVVNN